MTKYTAQSPRGRRPNILTHSGNLSRSIPNSIARWRKKRPGYDGRPMTQKELARLVGVSVYEIGRYERGDRKPPILALFRLCAALKVPPQALYPELWAYCQERVESEEDSAGLNRNRDDYDG